MFTARFLQTENRNFPHRSKMFQRRAAMRGAQTVRAQTPSELPVETVTPERTIALAVVDGTAPTCIQPCTDDLIMAGAEPATEVPGSLETASLAPTIIEPSPNVSDTAVAPETASSVPPTKGRKFARKRTNEASAAPQRKPAKCKKSNREDSATDIIALYSEPAHAE